jgi:hypothetical protein
MVTCLRIGHFGRNPRLKALQPLPDPRASRTRPVKKGEANFTGFLHEHEVALMIITLFEGQRSETYNSLAAAADAAKNW